MLRICWREHKSNEEVQEQVERKGRKHAKDTLERAQEQQRGLRTAGEERHLNRIIRARQKNRTGYILIKEGLLKDVTEGILKVTD